MIEELAKNIAEKIASFSSSSSSSSWRDGGASFHGSGRVVDGDW